MTHALAIRTTEARLPAAYEAAKLALERCDSVDECKDWADRAAALKSYAAQANDDTLRVMCDRIQLRAKRRMGELLVEIDARGDHRKKAGGGPSSRTEQAKKAGLSDRQRKTAVRLATVPKQEFDSAVESPAPPTVTALAERGTRSRESPPEVFNNRDRREQRRRLGGFVRDVERHSRKAVSALTQVEDCLGRFGFRLHKDERDLLGVAARALLDLRDRLEAIRQHDEAMSTRTPTSTSHPNEWEARP